MPNLQHVERHVGVMSFRRHVVIHDRLDWQAHGESAFSFWSSVLSERKGIKGRDLRKALAVCGTQDKETELCAVHYELHNLSQTYENYV